MCTTLTRENDAIGLSAFTTAESNSDQNCNNDFFTSFEKRISEYA